MCAVKIKEHCEDYGRLLLHPELHFKLQQAPYLKFPLPSPLDRRNIDKLMIIYRKINDDVYLDCTILQLSGGTVSLSIARCSKTLLS